MTLIFRLLLLPLFIRAMQSVTLEQVREAQRYASRANRLTRGTDADRINK